MKIYIEGIEITNGEGSIHHEKYATGTMDLEAGKKYPIEVEFFSDETDAMAQLL